MPIVSAISYELLKLSQTFQKNPIVKLFIAPGLFFQLFTTREPDDIMIKNASNGGSGISQTSNSVDINTFSRSVQGNLF